MTQLLSMTLPSVLCVTVFLVHVLILVSANKPRNFTIKLHPIHSPKLPFFPKNLTLQEKHKFQVEISKARASRASSSMANSQENISNVTIANPTELIQNPLPMVLSLLGHYVAEVSIGIPPQLMYLLVDTGSDLTWVQCDGCDPCFPINDPQVHNFQFQFSITYKNIPGNKPFCYGTSPDFCEFRQAYVAGQVVEGVLATDAFILGPESGGSDLIPAVLFGCGLRSNERLILDPPQLNNITGILGLSPGSKSILKQQNGLPQSFGYCIPSDFNIDPYEQHVYLNFGYEGNVGADVQTTYFVPDTPFYYVTLNGISVNGQNLELDPALFQLNRTDWSGGFTVDSGSTHTTLIKPAYDALEAAVIRHFADQYGWIPAENQYHSLCYKVEEGDYEFPAITLHLEGADFVADSSELFEYIEGFYYFNFVPTEKSSLWGSRLMVNHRFIYDLDGGFLLFVQETCYAD